MLRRDAARPRSPHPRAHARLPADPLAALRGADAQPGRQPVAGEPAGGQRPGAQRAGPAWAWQPAQGCGPAPPHWAWAVPCRPCRRCAWRCSWSGGLYLLHLARGLWRSGLRTPGQPAAAQPRPGLARDLLTNLGNVKAALFFASVFVAVLPADAGAAGLAAAVLLVTLTCAAWYLLLARGLSMPAVRAAYQRASRWLARGSALIMGGLGLSLLAAAFPLVQTGS
ncbi:MAG: LysE family transporter [Inhella sp.]